MAAGLDAYGQLLDHERQIIDLHQGIVDKVIARDAQGAVQAMNDHFDSAVHTLLLKGSASSGLTF